MMLPYFKKREFLNICFSCKQMKNLMLGLGRYKGLPIGNIVYMLRKQNYNEVLGIGNMINQHIPKPTNIIDWRHRSRRQPYDLPVFWYVLVNCCCNFEHLVLTIFVHVAWACLGVRIWPIGFVIVWLVSVWAPNLISTKQMLWFAEQGSSLYLRIS